MAMLASGEEQAFDDQRRGRGIGREIGFGGAA